MSASATQGGHKEEETTGRKWSALFYRAAIPSRAIRRVTEKASALYTLVI